MNHLADCRHHGWVFHQVEAEQFLAQILERTAEGVQLGVINQQEAVVDVGDLVEFHGRVLAVVPCDVECQRFGYLPGNNLRRDMLVPFGQHEQHRLVDIVVNQHNSLFRLPDQI